jgi:N-acetylglutamate synthase
MTPGQIAILERAGLNALPALRTVFDGGWVVRVSHGGSMRRSNSVTCLDRTDAEDLPTRIPRIEAVYRRFNLPTVFRATPLMHPALDQALTERGYRTQDEILLMTAELTAPLRPTRGTFPATQPEGWWDVLRSGTTPARLEEIRECLSLLALPSYYLLLRHEGVPACCLRVTFGGALAGFFDVATIPAARREGLARQAMFEGMSAAASRGASTAWLQVPAANQAAVGLYRSMGFTEAYRYRYRIAP